MSNGEVLLLPLPKPKPDHAADNDDEAPGPPVCTVRRNAIANASQRKSVVNDILGAVVLVIVVSDARDFP